MKRSQLPSRLKIRAKDLEHSHSTAHMLSLSELTSPKNSFSTSKQSTVQDPFLNMRLAGTTVPTLRPTCPSKRSTPRASTAILQVPTLPIPFESVVPLLPVSNSQRRISISARNLGISNSGSILPNIKPKILFPSAKKIMDLSAKQPIKVMQKAKVESQPSSARSRSKINSIPVFNFKRDIKTPYFSINQISSPKKIGHMSESESYGSESTALPQSGEISGFELSPAKKVSHESNTQAYDRIKKLILDASIRDSVSDLRDMSFGNIRCSSERPRPTKLTPKKYN